MRNKVAGAIALSMLSIAYPRAEAAPIVFPCPIDARRDLTDTLACYRQTVENQPLNYTMTGIVQLPGIEQRTYRLVSQSWSPDQLVRPDTWVHEVALYIPQDALPRRALVIANDGTRHPGEGETPRTPNDFLPDTLADIARSTRTAVISVSDVPNQLLSYADDGKPKAEDDSVARSWTLFMQSPHTRGAMPLHVPMAASIWRAMSLAERELTSLGIHRFVVSGISKRAWTTWLALIGDQRVDAIAPFAIDLLSTRAALENMYRSYGGNWPLAFYPYYAEGIDRTLDSPAFGLLMRIEDPLSYLGTRHGSRLAVPKYIVNASGDDFFVPDNSQLFRQASRCEGATHGAQFLALGHSPRHARFSRPVRQAHSARQGIAAGGRRADRDERPDNTAAAHVGAAPATAVVASDESARARLPLRVRHPLYIDAHRDERRPASAVGSRAADERMASLLRRSNVRRWIRRNEPNVYSRRRLPEYIAAGSRR